MLSAILLLLLHLNVLSSSAQPQREDFTYYGFSGSNMGLDGSAQITPNGLLQLTNNLQNEIGHAFSAFPLRFKKSKNDSAFSFSTNFVIAIVPTDKRFIGLGMAFFLSPKNKITNSQPSYMGLFNSSNDKNQSNNIFAVEFDTLRSSPGDIDNNHVALDNNSAINSVQSHPAAYFSDSDRRFKNLTLASGEPIIVWVDYNGSSKHIQVTISPLNTSKPTRPLLSMNFDLSPTILDSMYVGFSATTATLVSAHYVLGWSLKMNGQAEALDLSRLPELPRTNSKRTSRFLIFGVPAIILFLFFISFLTIIFIMRRRMKFAEVVEDWEKQYGTHRFSYKDLFQATRGFKDRELLGEGGFGMVYKGVLPNSKRHVAVKRVSHKSKQGMREFVAEIVSLGRLRHRNLVQLLGYCRRQGELLLVYDFMSNGSLDKYLLNQPWRSLSWSQRYRIIKGVVSGLLYLHEEWEQVVLHRDIKASNILLDSEMNGRLGDFGMAKLYDHGSNPQTTHVVGTPGYIAPELAQTGRATISTDVFAFGVFMLEVACGRRPIGDVVLVEWVWECWMKGEILEARDVKLGSDFVEEELEVVLKLGLLCSHPFAAARPNMRQAMQYLEGDYVLPDISSSTWNALKYRDQDRIFLSETEELLYRTRFEKSSVNSTSTYVESVLSGGH